jgi:hypothetical protein
MDDTRLATGIFLALLIIAAFTAHAGALTVTSKDSVSISIKDSKDATAWNTLASGDMGSYTLSKVSTLKFILTSEKEKVEPVVQVWPSSDIVIKANYAGGDAQIVQVGKGKIEGYYSYGKSSAYPWGIYWCIHDVGGKPVIIFSEFSKRSVWYSPVSSDTVEEIAAILNKGDIPDITLIQKAAGA